MTRRLYQATALIALHAAMSGCAAMFASTKEEVAITSAARDAEVLIDGAPYGRTPLRVALDGRRDHAIMIVGPDGKSFSCALTSSAGVGWIVVDAFALPPLGWLIDAATGSWKSLDDTSCHSPLQGGGIAASFPWWCADNGRCFQRQQECEAKLAMSCHGKQGVSCFSSSGPDGTAQSCHATSEACGQGMREAVSKGHFASECGSR